MYLVIMGHANCNFGGIGYFYSAFFMPMFFIISGFLEKGRLLKDIFIHGIKTLIIPYLLLYVIFSIFYVISGVIIKPDILNDPIKIIKPFLGIIIGENGYITKYASFVCGPLWFVLALFWIKIINCIIIRISKNNIVYYCFLTFIMPFIILILKHFEINLPLSLDSATLSFPFFAIGKICQRYSIIKEKNNMENLVIAFILFVTLFFTYKINIGVDVNQTKFGNNIFIFYILGTIGSFFLFYLCMAIYKKEVLIITLVSNGMIIILASHWFFTTAIGTMGINISNIMLKLIVPLAILFLCIIPVILAKKYFLVLLGGRK